MSHRPDFGGGGGGDNIIKRIKKGEHAHHGGACKGGLSWSWKIGQVAKVYSAR